MNIKTLATLLLALFCGVAYATDGKITISSPANGTMVGAKGKISLVYDATLGTNGDHFHLYVDGSRVDILRQLKGSTELDPLAAGKHHICLTENTKSHAPTGVESCVDVTAQ